MFASRGWMRFALFCNLLGAFLLFLSFQATSSDVKLISLPNNGTTAFCAYGTNILTARGSAISVGGPCPAGPDAKPLALVSIEHPRMVTIGFVLTLLGFLLQWFSFPSAPKQETPDSK